ncbi:FAD-dependent oxidoreductase, partial [Casaltella massiliensis]|nr:FAD-dependent oxidoreductase [Casaltella massiliensis]
MLNFDAGNYDVIVVGAGHAGCEAALATARMGHKTLVITLSLDSMALLPCNPSIGGTGKGQLVKEIDALGGQMGINIDKTFIQSRMLNTAKGPAVHSLRAQADKNLYSREMKHTVEKQENLTLRQAIIDDILFEDGQVVGVLTATKQKFS